MCVDRRLPARQRLGQREPQRRQDSPRMLEVQGDAEPARRFLVPHGFNTRGNRPHVSWLRIGASARNSNPSIDAKSSSSGESRLSAPVSPRLDTGLQLPFQDPVLDQFKVPAPQSREAQSEVICGRRRCSQLPVAYSAPMAP